MEITGLFFIITASLVLVLGLRQLWNHVSQARSKHRKALRDVGQQLALEEVRQPEAWLAFEGCIDEIPLVLRTRKLVQARRTEIITEVRCPTPPSVPAGFTFQRSAILGRLQCTLNGESKDPASLLQNADLQQVIEHFTEPLWANRPGTGTLNEYGLCLTKSGMIENPAVFHEMVLRTLSVHRALKSHLFFVQSHTPTPTS